MSQWYFLVNGEDLIWSDFSEFAEWLKWNVSNFFDCQIFVFTLVSWVGYRPRSDLLTRTPQSTSFHIIPSLGFNFYTSFCIRGFKCSSVSVQMKASYKFGAFKAIYSSFLQYQEPPWGLTEAWTNAPEHTHTQTKESEVRVRGRAWWPWMKEQWVGNPSC